MFRCGGRDGTLNLALVEEPFAEPEVVATWFVGSTSPRGHMLPVLTGLHRLRDVAVRRGCETLVIDTSGWRRLTGRGFGFNAV